MSWIKTTEQLPILNINDYPSTSEPVLVYDGFNIRVAYLSQYDDSPEWISNCSEGWNITNIVSHWQPLPPLPSK